MDDLMKNTKHHPLIAFFNEPFSKAQDIETLFYLSPYFPHASENTESSIRDAKQSVFISSLYIGNGELEYKILKALEDKIIENHQFEIKILLDGLRGHRDSMTLEKLESMTQRYPKNFHVGYYYDSLKSNDLLNTARNRRISRILEGNYGLQHSKFIIFDQNKLLITGANLSHDYFTNRIDRYIVLYNNDPLVQYYKEVFFLISQLGSYTDNETKAESDDSKSKKNLLKEFFTQWKPITTPLNLRWKNSTKDGGVDLDTILFPTIQIPNFGIRQDEIFFSNLINNVFSGPGSYYEIHLSTAYFNLPTCYAQSLSLISSLTHIYTSSQQTNGFYKSKGLSYWLPEIYDYILNGFIKDKSHIKAFQFNRPSWTFHAKGLWINDKNCPYPFLSTIGSSNYGYRSINKDVETQLTIITKDESLKKKFHHELETIRESSSSVSYTPLKGFKSIYVPCMTKIIRKLL